MRSSSFSSPVEGGLDDEMLEEAVQDNLMQEDFMMEYTALQGRLLIN